jgi:UDP-GlcNAc:undecaprenyl-phosphate GlcNAc-1-phosphate transferase
MVRLGIVVIVTAGVALVATRLAAGVARRFAILDVPGGHKGHAKATPLLGGAALLVAWLSGVLLSGAASLPLLPGAGLAWLLGTVDDVRRPGGLEPILKLGGQVLVGLVWLGFGGFEGSAVAWAAGLGWIVFTMNGFNLLDNTDGLCAAAALPPAVGLTVAAACGDVLIAGGAGAALAGALLGFLPDNRPRARIFLGDGGSHLIGFLVGALSLEAIAVGRPGAAARWMVPAAFALLPLVDTLTVTVSRIRRGRRPWQGDRNHLSHRLHRAGWGERSALVALGGVSALGSAVAVALLLL